MASDNNDDLIVGQYRIIYENYTTMNMNSTVRVHCAPFVCRSHEQVRSLRC